MRKLFWKIFPPFEVKLTLSEIQSFLKARGPLCADLVLREASNLAKTADKTVYSVRIDRMKPDHLALLLITNVVGRQLSGGLHHTYRGVLNLFGSDLLGVWTSAVSELKRRGYYTEEEVLEDMNWIKQQITEAG